MAQGKTMFAKEFLPDYVKCRVFLNADLIAAGLSPFAPETENMRAGRLFLARIKEMTKAGTDFCFETTLAGRGYARQFAEMKRNGYRIVLFFLWLPRVEVGGDSCGQPGQPRWSQRSGARYSKAVRPGHSEPV